jgi:hypothetical protein
MSNSSKKDEDPKEILSGLIQSAGEKGRIIVTKGRELMESGQELADVSEHYNNVVNLSSTLLNIENVISDWQYINSQADRTLLSLNSTSSFISGSTNTTAGTIISVRQPLIYNGQDPMGQKKLEQSFYSLNQVYERMADKDKVISLMERLGLQSNYQGKKSSIELFKTAHEAYETPISDNNPANTSLIPMREAILSAIDYLIKHRQRQEATPRPWSKFVSIGKQLSYSDIPPEFYTNLAFQWENLSNQKLSSSKTEDITRDEWRNRLLSSTLFLKSLLESIDPDRLRQ